MAGGTNVGEIQARITLEMAEFRRQMDEARRRIQDLERDSRRGADGMRDMSSALAGIGAGAALSKLVSEMRQAVDAATKLYSAFAGLNAVAKGFGVQTKDAQQAVQDLASRGFLSLTEAALAYKTALSTGLGLEQSTKLINSLADSAAYNRQSFYTMGGAIQASLDGIKNGNSVLADAVGVTKNLSVMQKEYAASIGTTVGKLTDAEKIQSAYNGFINEGAFFVGNADEAMQGFTGTQARFTQATNEASVAFGQAFTPLFQTVLETLTPTVIALADFVTENKAMTAAVAAGAVGVLGLVTVLATVPPALALIKKGIAALELSSGPIGIAVLAIGALASGIGYLTTAHAEAANATKELAKAQAELNAVLDKRLVDRTAADVDELRAKTEELTPVLEERAKLQERLNELQAAENNGTWMPEMFAETMEVSDAIGELDEKLRDLGYDGVEQATEKLGEMNAFVKAGTIAITDQEKAEAEVLATKKATLVQMSALAAQFKELNGLQTLDASQKNRLVDITEKLIEQYPELNAQQGEDGRIRADNIDTIIAQINTDKTFTEQAAEHSAQRIRNYAKEKQALADSVRSQIENLARLSNALAVVSGGKASSFADDIAARTEQARRQSSGMVGDIVTNGATALTAVVAAKANAEIDAKRNALLKEQQANADAARELEKLAASVETGTQTFNKDIIAPDPKKEPKAAAAKKEKAGKSPEELAAEARKAAYDADLKRVQFQSDFYNLTADEQIKKYEELRKKHAQFLKESVDDARTLTLQLKRLGEDSVQSRFAFAETAIDQEMKRQEDAGKSEREMADSRLYMWNNVLKRYKAGSDEYTKADEQARQARKDLASATEKETKDTYDKRADLIEKEVRRLEDSGAAEADIAAYKVAEWTKLRDQYSKDSEFYEKADEQLYQARKTLIDNTSKLAEALVKEEKSRIDTAKKADLEAIEARKEAYVAAQDEKIAAIDELLAKEQELNTDVDYGTALAEKNARIAELASAVGPEGIAEREQAIKDRDRMVLEHDRDLRKRELDSQKSALQKEKETQLTAYEKEKTDAEAQYEALAAAFDAYSGDIKTIETGIAAFRISESASANAAILTDLDTFVTQYKSKMAEVAATKAASQKERDLEEYNENKDKWTAAKSRGDAAEMARLAARNQELRDLYGVGEDNGKKLQHFSAGGIVQGAAGEAVPAIVHGGEIVLNASQQAALFDMVASPRVAAQAPAAPTYNTINVDMGTENVTLTDKVDVDMYFDEKTRAVQRLLAAKGIRE
ncbi:hypothetical protein [Paenibacillus graminis]|uniref:hypothetical protein n=1 Tax=Paenibacillus graminis TaxID=189425 RepID=UPI002DBF9971|nr:hypothetical protein [Paenibacillus graminis]MEC0167484.1 hypothetical protein [Paenibacillus graminis]